MQTETLILSTQLSNLFNPTLIHYLCRDGYRKTGNKFSIEFSGSKGYLSHLSIHCEGFQKEENRIFEIFNKNGSVKKKIINVYHSELNGVRLSSGSDKPKVIEVPKIDNASIRVNDIDVDDLPF